MSPESASIEANNAATGGALDRRTTRKLSAAIVAANLVGAAFVFVFLEYVSPTAITDRDLTRLNAIVFAVFMPAVLAVGSLWSLRVTRASRAWLVADRAPDEHERELTLRSPLRLAAVSAALWGAGAAIFAVLNAPSSAALGLQVGLTIVLGGLATCSMIYLLDERIARPLIERALAEGAPARPPLPGVATRMVLAWGFGTGLAVLGSGLVAGAFLLGGPVSPDRLAGTVVVLSLAALLGGLASAIIAARSVADPLGSVRRALAAVATGDLEVDLAVYDGSEVGLVQAGFNRMVAGLRERELIRDLFGRHVGKEVARDALERGFEMGGEERDVAILFVDVIGSTAFAATRKPAAVVDALNRFFALVVETTDAHGGWVNKFEGDAALCVFGAPTRHANAAGAALAAARELDTELRGGLHDLQAAIGVAAGPVVAGNVGAAERFEYTVIGDPVNEAARLTEAAKSTAARVLASETTVRAAGSPEAARWTLGESVTLRGRTTATRLALPAVEGRSSTD